MRSYLLFALPFLLAQMAIAQAAGTLRVAYAGSMGVVMDRFLGPSFAKANHVEYQGIGQGAYGLAHLLAAEQLQADVFITITAGPLEILKRAKLVGPAVPIASTEMVISYSPRSRFAPELKAAAAGRLAWWKVLETRGLRFGRTDPETDPQGSNIIFTFLLAERYYRQPDLTRTILGPFLNHAQIFSEPSLLSRLEAGQVDAASGYESATISHHLPYITLPDQINLSNPAFAKKWYDTVHITLTKGHYRTKTLSPQPLVFYAAVLKDAPDRALGDKFLSFLQTPAAQRMLRENGYGKPKGANF